MEYTLDLTNSELSLILDWFESSGRNYLGNASYSFPTEQAIINKITSSGAGDFTFSENELFCINQWMDNAINSNYGSAQYLFGFEQLLYYKIKGILFPSEESA
jgi:hypothetical protein